MVLLKAPQPQSTAAGTLLYQGTGQLKGILSSLKFVSKTIDTTKDADHDPPAKKCSKMSNVESKENEEVKKKTNHDSDLTELTRGINLSETVRGQ